MVGLTSIRRSGDKIEIVNQLLLPHTVEFLEIDTIEKAYDAIKSMKVSKPCMPTGHCIAEIEDRSVAPLPSRRSRLWLLRSTLHELLKQLLRLNFLHLRMH